MRHLRRRKAGFWNVAVPLALILLTVLALSVGVLLLLETFDFNN